MKASKFSDAQKAFILRQGAVTEYRRSVGVEEVVPGRRRSLVNFHSFRRCFITKAEQADQMEHIIAVVVGHKRTGMTLGRYSGGPLLEQARRCVEAVRLP
jgi:integrase